MSSPERTKNIFVAKPISEASNPGLLQQHKLMQAKKGASSASSDNFLESHIMPWDSPVVKKNKDGNMCKRSILGSIEHYKQLEKKRNER